jgi:tetratricopeptide (TPR) repeat protein
LCRQVQHTPHLFTVIWGLHEIALYRADYLESLTLSQECLRIAEESQDHALLLQAHHAMWGSYHFMGNQAKALEHAKSGLSLYQQPIHEVLSAHYAWHDAGACALEIGALALWLLGCPDQAIRWQQELIEFATRLTQPLNIADCFAYVALFNYLLRRPALVQPYAEQTYRTGVEHDDPGLRITGSVTLGWSIAMQGQVEEGSALTRQGIAEAEAMGQRHHKSQYTTILAEIYMAAGRPAEAIEVLDQAIAAFHQYRDLICAPDLWTLKGAALLILGAPEIEIEACYTMALSVAQELGAKISELRAAKALASMRLSQGRREEGYQLLAPCFAWFSEGFDIVDLVEAQVMLDTLIDS